MRTLLILLLLCAPAQSADLFKWSKPAKHHNAAVACSVPKGTCTGVYVVHNGMHGILTAAHLFRDDKTGRYGGSPKVEFQDGITYSGLHWLRDRHNHDVAFIYVKHPNIQPLTLAEAVKNQSSESVTFGGPNDPTTGSDRLRTHMVTPNNIRNSAVAEYSMSLISGDSGSPILQGKSVVGIITGTCDRKPIGTVKQTKDGWRFSEGAQGKDDWDIHANANAVNLPVLRAFLGRLALLPRPNVVNTNRRVCTPFGCYVMPQYNVFEPWRVKGPSLPARIETPSGRDGPRYTDLQNKISRLEARLQSMERNQIEFAASTGDIVLRLESIKDGKDGKDGRDGAKGEDGASPLVDYVEIMKRLPSRRVVWSENGKIIDEETYKPGEPIVLDIARLKAKK